MQTAVATPFQGTSGRMLQSLVFGYNLGLLESLKQSSLHGVDAWSMNTDARGIARSVTRVSSARVDPRDALRDRGSRHKASELYWALPLNTTQFGESERECHGSSPSHMISPTVFARAGMPEIMVRKCFFRQIEDSCPVLLWFTFPRSFPYSPKLGLRRPGGTMEWSLLFLILCPVLIEQACWGACVNACSRRRMLPVFATQVRYAYRSGDGPLHGLGWPPRRRRPRQQGRSWR